jgi:hypothetical protein
MKKLFLYLLRKYSTTEAERMEIYKELWYKVKEEYNEQTSVTIVPSIQESILRGM